VRELIDTDKAGSERFVDEELGHDVSPRLVARLDDGRSDDADGANRKNHGATRDAIARGCLEQSQSPIDGLVGDVTKEPALPAGAADRPCRAVGSTTCSAEVGNDERRKHGRSGSPGGASA
jgi:hypothetical protein